MIVGHKSQATRYMGLDANLDAALQFIQNTDLNAMDDGTYDILGENAWVRIFELTTKPLDQGKMEYHKEFLDIQMILQGEEIIRCGYAKDIESSRPSSPEKDLYFCHCPGQDITLHHGDFVILFPDDIHAPGCSHTPPTTVRKALFKVRLST